jgi:hypothetical protein
MEADLISCEDNIELYVVPWCLKMSLRGELFIDGWTSIHSSPHDIAHLRIMKKDGIVYVDPCTLKGYGLPWRRSRINRDDLPVRWISEKEQNKMTLRSKTISIKDVIVVERDDSVPNGSLIICQGNSNIHLMLRLNSSRCLNNNLVSMDPSRTPKAMAEFLSKVEAYRGTLKRPLYFSSYLLDLFQFEMEVEVGVKKEEETTPEEDSPQSDYLMVYLQSCHERGLIVNPHVVWGITSHQQYLDSRGKESND